MIERLAKKGLSPEWANLPRLMFRDIARNDDTRTLISCLHPAGFVSTYDTPMIVPNSLAEWAEEDRNFYAAYMSSFIADFLIRPYVDKHIKSYVLKRIPIPHYRSNRAFGIVSRLFSDAVSSSWTNDIEYQGSLLQAEVEGALAAALGLTDVEITGVLNGFASIRQGELRQHGTFQTLDRILESADRYRGSL